MVRPISRSNSCNSCSKAWLVTGVMGPWRKLTIRWPSRAISGSSSIVSSRSNAAKGVAKSNGQMVERVIRHPFLTWVVWKHQCQAGCPLKARASCQFAGLRDQIRDYRSLIIENSRWDAIPPDQWTSIVIFGRYEELPEHQ